MSPATIRARSPEIDEPEYLTKVRYMFDAVARVRRFNRAVTSEVGALDSSFLGRGRPLGAARVLNAIGHGRSDVAEIRDYLGLDSGLMSRLLRSLEDEGTIATTTHADDARRRVATLTRAGRREFSAYEALSNAQAESMLARHPHREALLAAMDLIASALGRERTALAEIKRLWVAPSARGQKLGRRLMDAVEDAARELGIAVLRLDTNSALAEAGQLYRSSGWTEIPRFNDDPYPDLFFEKRL